MDKVIKLNEYFSIYEHGKKISVYFIQDEMPVKIDEVDLNPYYGEMIDILQKELDHDGENDKLYYQMYRNKLLKALDPPLPVAFSM